MTDPNFDDDAFDDPDCTPLEKGQDEPMTLSEALADPDAFVAGMNVDRTWSLFIPFKPKILRAMLGDTDDKIEPHTFGGRQGSLVTTTRVERFNELQARYNRAD